MTTQEPQKGTHDTREVEEWEKIKEEKHTETWRNDYYGEVVINKHLLHHQLQQSRHSLYTSLVAAVEGVTEDYADDGGLYVKFEDLITIINSIFKE